MPDVNINTPIENVLLDSIAPRHYFARSLKHADKDYVMKIANSLKALKKRDADCKVVRRKGRTYVINKKNPRYKARQG